jgi:hypothetical protein
MKFSSFEEALQVCMRAENGSPAQQEAMEYCLRNAPADLRLMLAKRLGVEEEISHGHGCGCGEAD